MIKNILVLAVGLVFAVTGPVATAMAMGSDSGSTWTQPKPKDDGKKKKTKKDKDKEKQGGLDVDATYTLAAGDIAAGDYAKALPRSAGSSQKSRAMPTPGT